MQENRSLSDAEAMPGQPDGFTVWDTIFREDDGHLREDDTAYYADEIGTTELMKPPIASKYISGKMQPGPMKIGRLVPK